MLRIIALGNAQHMTEKNIMFHVFTGSSKRRDPKEWVLITSIKTLPIFVFVH